MKDDPDKAPAPPHHLSLDPDAMRALGYQAVDRLVERWTGLAEAHPRRGADRAELDERLADLARPPEGPTDASQVLDEAVYRILSESARIDHPRFWAYVPSAPTWPSVVADFLVAGHNVFQGTWQSSAGPSWVELQVLDWFREWLGMPEGAGGVFTSGGSMANVLAVVLARHVAGSPEHPVVYLSDQGHGSLIKAALAAGLMPDQIRILPTGDDLLLRPKVLEDQVRLDRAAGLTPILACANGGATNTGRVDPLLDLAETARSLDIRLHVDAAFGGFAVLTERGRRALRGIEEADSVTLDPHKWLFQPFECGCLMVKDPEELEAAFRNEADYMQDTELGAAQVNFGSRGLQLTRSARAMKVWMSVRTFGMDRIRQAVEAGVEMAHLAEAEIIRRPQLELLSPASMGIVAWRCRPDGVSEDRLGELNRRVQGELMTHGHAMLSSTRLGGRYALRFCFVNPRVEVRDVIEVLDEAIRRADPVRSEAAPTTREAS